MCTEVQGSYNITGSNTTVSAISKVNGNDYCWNVDPLGPVKYSPVNVPHPVIL